MVIRYYFELINYSIYQIGAKMNKSDVSKVREKKINRQKTIMSIFGFLYFMVCGFLGGLLLSDFIKSITPKDKISGAMFFIAGILVLLVIIICLLIHLYIHEIGHMIFGFFSGYEFQSIRFGSLMIYKLNGKLKLAKYTLAGTGGQCLMTPPDVSDDKLPTSLYNLGGIIMNGGMSIIFGITYVFCESNPGIRLISALFVLVGLFLIIINGIPLEAMGNDGHNAIHLKKDLRARRAFRIQLLIAGQLALKHSISDMPSEWFEWDYRSDDNALAVTQGILRLSWLISTKKMEEAYELSTFFIENVPSLVGIHQTILQAEHLFCMIVLNKNEDEIRNTFVSQHKNFKALRLVPSIQRLLFVYYYNIEKDSTKALEAKKCFEKIAAKYPYPSEIVVERELMDMIENSHES